MLSVDLLAWYDANGRTFPWRAKWGAIPDPYQVWLSEVMLQQTTTTTVIPYFHFFISKWPTVQCLATAHLDEVLHAWQGLGYYSRARSLHKAAQILQNGFPESYEELLKIPGIGPYTAGAIAAIAYDHQTSPVDGNIARIYARLSQIDEVKPQLYTLVEQQLRIHVPSARNGDFIQGLMDVGATICLPKEPKCHVCPLSKHCLSYKNNSQGKYPLKATKKARPVRHGRIFWLQDDKGQVLIRRRAEKGLLGGMMEFPSTPWIEGTLLSTDIDAWASKAVPIEKRVEHTFTHFHLILEVVKGKASDSMMEGLWVKPSELHLHALPTLMKKVAKTAMES